MMGLLGAFVRVRSVIVWWIQFLVDLSGGLGGRDWETAFRYVKGDRLMLRLVGGLLFNWSWQGCEGLMVVAWNWAFLMSMWSLRGRILVSECRCCIGVDFVHPVAVRRAEF